MQDLKSEALRPRHWEKLMKETGKSFDMDPKTFTLANLFRMELHKFASIIRYECHDGAFYLHLVGIWTLQSLLESIALLGFLFAQPGMLSPCHSFNVASLILKQ